MIHFRSYRYILDQNQIHSKMSNGSPNKSKNPRVCCALEFAKLFISHCDQCKFGILFSKRCISFGQECMGLNLGVFFNSAVCQVMFSKSRLNFRDHVRRKCSPVSQCLLAMIYVGIIGIFLLIDIHQLMFLNTLLYNMYKALKVCRCLNCKHRSTNRLSPVLDSVVKVT